jgi:hypothetical protein
LRHGGIILLRTGSTSSWTASIQKEKWYFFDMNRHGGHVCFFNPQSIRKFGESLGFNVEHIRTRNVKILDKSSVPRMLYRLSQPINELLSYPTLWFEKGHDMDVILRKSTA